MASRRYFVVGLLAISILHNSKGDINIHNPRGSNNRLNEENRPRDNANRLFNSQNNNRGGHNVGVEPLYYYSGSKLEIQWAVQHSCGDQNNNCEIIMQYMCGENVRDGSTTNTPPLNQRACRNGDCNTDHRFGMHEDFHYFEKCQLKERNMGLFTATQDVRRSARSTRQNNNGDRYGYECAEERDYYPYWGPSPWKDIVVFTNNPDRCPYYQQESQNVQAKYECIFDDEVYAQYRRRDRVRLYLNQQDCEWSTVTIGKETYTGRWVRRPSHRLPPPDCRPSPWSRDNHQGNTIGGEFMKYDWTIPELDDDDQNCVIRMRYNISTNDYDAWETDATYNEKQPDTIWKQFGMMDRDAKKRQYVFRNNPKVDVFGIHNRTKAFRLQVALNTAQYGRTFQDRTHVFRVLRRPKALKKKVIHNVNVRGKRGNIVQVYPSTEYDFVPNMLRVTGGEMVHFQWTGSDKNPRNNDGNGAIQTDRSNIVQLAHRTFKKGRWPVKHNNTYFATNYPSHSEDFLGLGWKKTDELAFLERCVGPDPLLDEKSPYFDLGPQTLEKTGTFHYMSTRNNDFSKRSQKAVIYVADGQFLAADKGVSYRGFQSVTTSGRVCQRWDRQTPHRHSFNPKRNRRYNVEENFCRNPNKRERPWCYTTDPDVEWEYCDIAIEADNIGRTRRTLGDENNVFPKTDQDETGAQVQDEL